MNLDRAEQVGAGAMLGLYLGLTAMASAAPAEKLALRGYREFTHSATPPAAGAPAATVHTFAFREAERARIFPSKLYSDFELTTGNRLTVLALRGGPADAIDLAGHGLILPLLTPDGKKVLVLTAADQAALQQVADSAFGDTPLRRAGLTHPLFMDKWDRYPLGVWQGAGDFEQDDRRKDPDSFYRWLGEIGLNPQMNLGTTAIDLTASDNVLTWLRYRFAAYGVHFQRTEWLENNVDLYNRNPYLTQGINPHAMARWIYYGEQRDAPSPLRDVQNAGFLNCLKPLAADPNQMAILDPDGEIGPFDFQFWGAAGPMHRRNFVRYLREVRKFSLTDVSRRYTGRPDAFRSWDEVDLADWRTFYGWTAGAVDLAGEWRGLRDEKLEGYALGWMRPDYDDGDWVRLHYPGDALMYGLAARGSPLWLRRSLRVDPARFPERIRLTVATLNNAPVQVFLNGKRLGTLEPRFHTANVIGQFDVTGLVRERPDITVALRFAAGDTSNGPVFLTAQEMVDFPTADPQLNARRFDHEDYIEWAVADTVRSTLLAIRSIDPDRPIKVHAFGSSPYGWRVLGELGGYSHHTGSGAGWCYTDPKARGLERNLQDSSEPGGPMENLRDLKGLFGNLVFMGKNAHDYFISLQSLTRDPAMRAWFEAKLPVIKVMGRANVNASPLASIRGSVNTRYIGEFARVEDWRFGVNLARGGEMTVLLDEVRVREGHLPYPAMVDEGTPCWDAAMTAALTRYAEAGGVLVLNCLSGIHTFEERGAGAGPALAGVRLTGTLDKTGRIIRVKEDDLLPGLPADLGTAYSRAFTPNATVVVLPGTEVLATYSDGAPLLTRRQLGRGTIFFCAASNYPGAFIEALVRRFGLTVYAKVEGGADLLRTLQSNNGCEDLLMVRGLGGKPATVTWTFPYPPGAIYDPVTGAPVPATIAGNVATFTVTIPDWDFTYFAARRPGADPAFAHWFRRQTEIWGGYVRTDPPPEPPLFRHLDLNRGWKAVGTASLDQARALLKIDDQTAGLVPAELVLRDAPGAVPPPAQGPAELYRREFDLPRFWERDSTVQLFARGQLHDCRYHGFNGPGEIYLNGTRIWEGKRLDIIRPDVTPALKPGRNRLEIVHEGNGIMPSLFLVRTAQPEQTLDLAGPWQAVDGLRTAREVQLPGKAETAFVYRDFDVPASLAGRELWLRVDGNCGFVIVNGRLRYWETESGLFYTPAPLSEVNVTPDIRCGAVNRIVLGTGILLNGWRPGGLEYRNIELASYPPGRWSADGKGIRAALTDKELQQVQERGRLVGLYPLIQKPMARPEPAPPTVPANLVHFTPPPPILDLELAAPAGAVSDRGPEKIPVTVKGTVKPFSEKGGVITGLRLCGEVEKPGYLEMPSPVFRKKVERKDVTFCAWVKPLAINRSGGALLNWCSYLFDWRIVETGSSVAIFDRKFTAEAVLRQRAWQFLTLTMKGGEGTLYVNGIEVGGQRWTETPGTDAPVTIGSVCGRSDFLNARLAAFTIYPGVLEPAQIMTLCARDWQRFTPEPAAAFPEDDLFRLKIDPEGAVDVADIPGTITLQAGVKPVTGDGKPYLAFDGQKSYIEILEHGRVGLMNKAFSLVLDLRPAVGTSGMLFRRHHEMCLMLEKDGTLTLDANIGRNSRAQFPKVVRFGEWNRLMLTYDGRTASLVWAEAPPLTKVYPGSLAYGRAPLCFGADPTQPGYPAKIQMDLRELRFLPVMLDRLPAVPED